MFEHSKWCEKFCNYDSTKFSGWQIGDLLEITDNFGDQYMSNFWDQFERPEPGTVMVALSYEPRSGSHSIVKVLHNECIRYANSNLVKKVENSGA